MAFFKKGKKEVTPDLELPELPGFTELPSLPQLPELPKLETEQKIEPTSLSTFPSNQINNSFGIEAIKSNISLQQADSSGYIPSQNPMIEKRAVEMEEKPRLGRIAIPAQHRTSSFQKEPIFIKLDKFREAVEKFQEIKYRVNEIENSLVKLKDVKDKEENELKEWEEEVRLIKEKVENIDNSLFSKI